MQHLEPLPKVFVIGDSISMQYGPYLEKYLAGLYQYDRKRDDGRATKDLDNPQGANGGDSSMVLDYLRRKLQEESFSPDILMLNCGLHDIKRNPDSGEIQVPIEAYEQNLIEIFQLLQDREIKVIWVTTTPLEEERHNRRSTSFHRYEKDLHAYNEVADHVTESLGIEAIDLHRFTLNLGPDIFIDHVHFDKKTRTLQAAFIAGFLIK